MSNSQAINNSVARPQKIELKNARTGFKKGAKFLVFSKCF